VADITRIYAFDKRDTITLRRAAALEALSESWRDYFRDQLTKMSREKTAGDSTDSN